LTTEKFRVPVVAFVLIVMFATILVGLFTVVELTVMSEPTLTDVTPLMKFAPVNVMSIVCPLFPPPGKMLARPGTGFTTVNV